MAERARPGGPAAAGDELPAVSVRLKILLAVPQHLLQSGFVLPHGAVASRGGKLRVQQRPQRVVSAGPPLVH